MSAAALSLGCRLNFAESEALAAGLPDTALLVNSCAVTCEAVRQTRQAIRRAYREQPGRSIVVAGCAVQLDPAGFRAMPEVAEIRLRDEREAQGPVAGLLHKVKSFVAIQTGCDHRCTFCTIWQARGPSRSVPFAAIRTAVERELARGAREIVLTGVDITDHSEGLGAVCRRLLGDLPDLGRLRLSSLDSIEIDPVLETLFGSEPRLMPHVHLSLQAGDDLVLKRMKRRHSRAQAVAVVKRLKERRPDLTVGADLIAGFPTESDEAALNTVRLVDDCEIVAAHVFPFSPRPGTPAARMPQVDRAIVKARAARLRARANERRSAWLDGLVGTRSGVLIEGEDGTGHTDHFAPVRVAGAARGVSGTALLTGRVGGTLVGTFE